MYSIFYQIPGDAQNFSRSSWYGGNTEEEAKQNAISSAVSFHNRYSEDKIEESDVKIVKCSLSGNYDSVLKGLQNDRS